LAFQKLKSTRLIEI